MKLLSVCMIVLLVAGLSAAQNCPPLWASDGNYCYRFVKEARTFVEASDFCSKFSSCATGAGASLAKLSSTQEESGLDRYLTTFGDPFAPMVWLGLGDPLNLGTLTWRDGTTPVTTGYMNFAQGTASTSNADCVLRDNTMRNWRIVQCIQPNAFVCQMERVQPQQPPAAVPV